MSGLANPGDDNTAGAAQDQRNGSDEGVAKACRKRVDRTRLSFENVPGKRE